MASWPKGGQGARDFDRRVNETGPAGAPSGPAGPPPGPGGPPPGPGGPPAGSTGGAGVAPPPGVFTAPGTSGGGNNRKTLVIGVAIALILGLLIGGIVVAAGSGKKASADVVLREPQASDG